MDFVPNGEGGSLNPEPPSDSLSRFCGTSMFRILEIKMTAFNGDSRYSFTTQFLRSSWMFARQAAVIETDHPTKAGEEVRCLHRGLVSSCVIQCVAAVETESAEVTFHGPGGHLGSNGMDKAAHELLLPLAEVMDKQKSLSRYNLILHLLGRVQFKTGERLWQDMDTLVRLRNEVVHYKSKWRRKMDGEKLFATLQNLRHQPPPFIESGHNFFPHRCLSADCAKWAVRTSLAFIEEFYKLLGIKSPLDGQMHVFEGL